MIFLLSYESKHKQRIIGNFVPENSSPGSRAEYLLLVRKFRRITKKCEESVQLISDLRDKNGKPEIRRYVYVSNPISGSEAEYILLKQKLEKLDPTHGGRVFSKFHQLKFNTHFLKSEKKRVGLLKCAYCGKNQLVIRPLNKKIKTRAATVDHFLPISKGGERFDVNNLVVACESCNQKKANKVYPKYTLKHLDEEKLQRIPA